jgi:hypothetical protein
MALRSVTTAEIYGVLHNEIRQLKSATSTKEMNRTLTLAIYSMRNDIWTEVTPSWPNFLCKFRGYVLLRNTYRYL